MKAPQFWDGNTVVSRLLEPVGMVYGVCVAARQMVTPHKQVKCPVICVGNLVVGGAGKTPVVLALADWFLAQGRSPHFLTRGYGGSEVGPVRVDLERHTAQDVGDEALLLAQKAPTWVSRHRPSGAAAAEVSGADLILMDDGFQNNSIHKDFSLVVVDGNYGIGNGRVLPAGPLREFPEYGLSRANVAVILGESRGNVDTSFLSKIKVIKASLEPCPIEVSNKKNKIVAFAGIARPDKFFATLERLGFDIAARRAFADHHYYKKDEIYKLKELARQHAAGLITTEKDFVRIGKTVSSEILFLPVRVVWENQPEVDDLLSRVLSYG